MFRLLAHAFMTHCPLPTAEMMLNTEITWLKKTKVGYDYFEMFLM